MSAPRFSYYLLGQGYRAYSPLLMRFNNPDDLSPFGRGGLNAYAYCVGDPVNLVDPDGHSPLTRMFGQLRKLFARTASRLNKPKGMKRLVETSSPSIASVAGSPPPSPPPRPPKRKTAIDASDVDGPPPALPPRKPVIEAGRVSPPPPPLPPRKAGNNGSGRPTSGRQQSGVILGPRTGLDTSQQTLDEAKAWLKLRRSRQLIDSNVVLVIGDPIRPVGQIRAGNNTRQLTKARDDIRS